jgi:hypothetical protein
MPSPEQDDRPAASVAKRPWRSPRLTVYGDLRTLTRAKGGTKQDGGAKPSTRVGGPPA